MAALIKALPVRGETVLPQMAKRAVAQAAEPVSVSAPSAVPPALARDPLPPTLPSEPVAPVPAESAETMRARIENEHREVLAALESEARDAGYAAGLAEGEQAGQEQYRSAIAALAKIVEATNAAIGDTIDAAEEVVGAIAFEAVCKIVGRQLTTSEGVRAVVAELVSRSKRDDVVSIKVSPADMALLSLDQALVPEIAGIPIEADSEIELGGSVVELKGGYLDGRIETQFRSFAQSIKDAVHRRG